MEDKIQFSIKDLQIYYFSNKNWDLFPQPGVPRGNIQIQWLVPQTCIVLLNLTNPSLLGGTAIFCFLPLAATSHILIVPENSCWTVWAGLVCEIPQNNEMVMTLKEHHMRRSLSLCYLAKPHTISRTHMDTHRGHPLQVQDLTEHSWMSQWEAELKRKLG